MKGKLQPSADSQATEWHIITNGPIGPDYGKIIEDQLAQRPAGTTKIVHHLTSGGGDVYGGYEGYIALQKIGIPIKTIIEGQAQSMATFVALAGNEVEMMDPGTFMIHEPYFANGVAGRAEDLDKASKELKDIQNTMAQRYAQKMNRPVEEIQALMKNETRLTPRQAKDMGLVDKVITPGGNVLASQENFLNKLEETFMKLFKKQAVANATPVAKDFPLQDGTTLSIMGDNIAPGVQATINGQPANGLYVLADGSTITCVAGAITEIEQAAARQQQTAQQLALQQTQKLAALEKEVAALKASSAEKIKAEEAIKLAEAEKQKLAEAEKQIAEAKKTTDDLAAAQAKIKELEATAAGNQNPAPLAMGAVRLPSGHRGTPEAAALEGVKMFLYQNGFEYLTQHPGGMQNYRPGPSALSILETNFSYTWPGILTTDIFYKPQLGAPAIADMVIIDQGIKDRKRYNLVTQLDKILKPYGGCTRVFNGNRQLINDVLVLTKEFQVSESWCKDDFTQQLTGVYNMLASEWLKTGNRSFDPSGTAISTIIDKVLGEALARDVFRRFSFAAGNSSDDDYNQFDGLWDRLIDSSGQSNYCVVRANSPVFGGTALGTTDVLAAGIALTNLEAVYIRSKQILKNLPNKTFWVTRSVWDNYYNSLSQINQTGNTEQAFKNIQDGITTLTYKGIPVKPIDLWDAFLQESDNPLFGVTKHLILLTVKDNHIFGVENGADLNKIEGWYERKDRKFYYEADMKMGYNYLHCDLATIAY